MSGFLAEITCMGPLALFDMGSMVLIGLAAVLLFGGDLPRMGRKFGKVYSEFQRSVGAFKKEVSSVVSDITSEINDTPTHKAGTSASRRSSETSTKNVDEDLEDSSAPKFEPPKK